MTRSRPIITFLAGAAVIPLVALSIAACGGGGSAATAATPKTSSGASATVDVSKSSLGSILVDSTGRTLYLFKADVGMHSVCTGACALKWPPLLATGKSSAGVGLTVSKLATITRSDGNRQITYNGHPLYLFVKDHKPGDVKGQGVTAFGAAWFALSPEAPPTTSRQHDRCEPSRPSRGGSVSDASTLRRQPPAGSPGNPISDRRPDVSRPIKLRNQSRRARVDK
jgi:predicted lipoprotein with Yx(FWY)xxD motif